jgi:hypothetical protein
MKPLSLFGSVHAPLRCSSLDGLNRCPMKHVLAYLEGDEDLTGEAAETGSVAHAAIAAYHRARGHQEGVEAGLAAIRDCLGRFPRADPEDAARHFADYVADPRHPAAEVVAVERPVRLVLPPAEGDPTGREVVIEGTLDQVRRHDGRLLVCDVKTGATPGWQMVHDYLFQVVAYAAAATAELGEPVEPGYLIRTRGYRKKGVRPADAPEGVLWHFGLAPDQCRVYLDQVRELVAQVRAGAVRFGPGLHCAYCPLQGIWNCTARAEKYYRPAP